MLAAQSGQLHGISRSEIPRLLSKYIHDLEEEHPETMAEIASSQQLSLSAQEILLEALQTTLGAFSSQTASQ